MNHVEGSTRSGLGGGHLNVPDLHPAQVPGDDSRERGGDLRGTPPRVRRERLDAWWHDSAGPVLDDSAESFWPPGPWERHRINEGDTDDGERNGNEPVVTVRTAKDLDLSASSKAAHRKIPSTYPPPFSATPSESYLEWKRSVQCWIAGEGGQLPEDVINPHYLSVLTGRASVIVRHLQIEEVNKVGGLDLVFKALEASPMVKELDGQRGEKAQREFLRRRRQASESMESFIMRVQAQRSVMEEEDSTFAVCDRFLVGYILDHAELTLKDRVMVLAAAQNQMTSDSIFPALRRMGPFLQGTVPIGKGVIDAPLLPELQPDHSSAASKGGDVGGKEHRRPWHSSSFKAHVVEDTTGYSGEEEEPDTSWSWSLGEGEPVPEELEAATHAAMAAYTTSQAKLKALKQARGYFRRPEPAAQTDRKERLRKLMAENPCRACGQLGHWSKDPECPKNAKGAAALTSSSSASLVASPAVSPESEHAAMSAVLEQMLKDQASSAPRAYTVCAATMGGGDFVSLVNAPSNEDLLTARMVVDLGCLRTVAGMQWVVSEAARCKQLGRFVQVQRTLDYFRFGDGERRPSHYRVFLEVGLSGHVGALAINAVDYPCPPLLSKGICSALGLHLDCGSGKYELTKLGVRARHFVTSGEGHFLIAIDEFQPSWPCWQNLLEHGHQPKLVHEEVRMFELRQGVPVGKGAKKSAASARGSVGGPEF